MAERFINSHNLICLQYKSHPGIILLRAGTDWKGEHFLVYSSEPGSELFKGFFTNVIFLFDFSYQVILNVETLRT